MKKSIENRSKRKSETIGSKTRIKDNKRIVNKMNTKCEQKSIESNVASNDLSPKRLRKQSFVQQMYCRESANEDIVENDMESEGRHDSDLSLSSQQIECSFCYKTFDTNSKLLKHLRIDHKMVKPLEENLPFPELVESNSDSEGRIKCGKCCFRTNSEAKMILHSINHNINVINETNKGTKPKSVSKLKCPTCEQKFSKTLLEKHVFIHTSEKPFKCEKCRKEFISFQNLTNHMKKHETSSEPLNCEICCVGFKSKKSLQKHQMIHRKDRTKSHLCDVCGLSFYDKESLKSHAFRIHLPKKARKFQCDFNDCRYSCLYKHQMLEHQKVHSDDKPWVCDQCDYRAKSKWTFKKHYRKHTKERPFKCPHCDYASSLSSNLTRHLRIHTGSKPFKCPYCSYVCNNHENLRKHVLNTRKHMGLYLYNCTHCLFGTNVFSDLRKHIEQTHNDIYTVEQIDRMISSIYHKHEDNTSVFPNSESNVEPSNESTSNEKQIKPNSETNNSSFRMVFIKPIIRHSEDSNEIILPNIEFEDIYTYCETNDIKLEEKKAIISKNSQNNSEILILDSNVLEAQEVCVSERLGAKTRDKIVVSVSK